MVKVAINGFGRIGRLVFRLMEADPEFEVVAINDLTDADQLAYLLKYDTNHRNYRIDEIHAEGEYIVVGDRKVRVYAEKDPAMLPWKDLDIDVVFECTGHFTDKDKAMAHINAGAKKVIISAPLLESINNAFCPKYSLLLNFLISFKPILHETIPSLIIYSLSPSSPFLIIFALGGNSFFFNFCATLYLDILSNDSKIDILFKKSYFSFKTISLFLLSNSRHDSLSIAYNSTFSLAFASKSA